MTEDQIKHLVDRFLGWRLPKNFNPDAGISYTRPNYAPSVDATPYGTNLFDATQADTMVRHMIEGMPEVAATPGPVETGTVHKLKTWPEYFTEVLSGRKPFEWRVDDRDFKLGDTLVLQEYIPHPENPGRDGKYTRSRDYKDGLLHLFAVVNQQAHRRNGSMPTFAPSLTRCKMIAALYVAKNGSYVGLDGIDAWPETRDARLYAGPHPVVAHPPCQRWGKLWAGQPLHIKHTGERKAKGADGGCFEAALSAVRSFGGVLEHPCDSHAWAHFGLHKPPRAGGWIAADIYGGWTACIEQGRYGHYARKPTWLYAYGCTLPELDWGKGAPRLDPAVIERMGFKRAQRLGEVGGRGGGKDSAPRIGTPIPFRDLLISIARTAAPAFAEAAE